ncbi:MAG: 16S rRNA (adenine(1518)-N(6)/adenine(1519)-N(6))-dimethyltransferase RsmA [Bacteroidetes bacterium]|uniref:Ribosomal RNA small subunit methyltransferase A n=1 Tax=Candidatus Limisoma faecipullorum TaxID=2840854 RepID=A0A9D9IQ13_9BACT|nr:16S rRNA (adenine(1518)-N(6)/adenine(1519)-N(6))-dimethyltransferase RsmA [Candidatus Limisoma faecipullorum]
MKVKPKKSLGQHFLTDLSIAERIAGTLDAYTGIPVVEVGPGMGVLTQFLIEKGHGLHVVELDEESVEYLHDNFPALDGRIIAGDFLQLNLSDIYNGQFCVIGNYPYNISSQIFFKVLDYRNQIVCCSGMLQKEVAERITSGPGSKAYGILSVLLQAWYDMEYLFTVNENVFNPPPKVKSGVIRLTRNKRTSLDCDENFFKTVVKTSFGQRRKTLRNSVRSLAANPSVLSDPIFNMRPEQLSVEEFVKLTNLLK